jgi:glyoxalase family protein
MQSTGLHHITAIAVDPQANVDFYTRILGLRLVKKTVNFDAPDVYHLYYGDRTGRPGTILTFFPFLDAGPGKIGAGQASAIRFQIAREKLEPMMLRLAEHGIDCAPPTERYGEAILAFKDPEGLPLEIVGTDRAAGTDGLAVAGFDSLDLAVAQPARTVELLTSAFGYAQSGEAPSRKRYSVEGTGMPGTHVDIIDTGNGPRGHLGGGTVHHVAFRAKDEGDLNAWRRHVAGIGFDVTDVLDRQYFKSIYFREPGGILFEIATDPPGFAVDETVDQLGRSLKLPAWLEPKRAMIERRLPPLKA